MTAEALSADLRFGSGAFLVRRRAIAALALASMASLNMNALYQLGIIPRVPEPPLPGFDATKLSGSAQAYRLLGVPDGVLGVGNFAITLALASMGGADRARAQPLIPLAMATKVAFDASQIARSIRMQVRLGPTWCFWCLVVSAAACAMAPLAAPEARAAIQALRGNAAPRIVSAQQQEVA